MAKINISVPDEFLRELDVLAEKTDKSRSELLREGVEIFRHEWERREEEARIQKRREEACKKIDEFRRRYGHLVPPGLDSVKMIRELRDRDPADKWNDPDLKDPGR